MKNLSKNVFKKMCVLTMCSYTDNRSSSTMYNSVNISLYRRTWLCLSDQRLLHPRNRFCYKTGEQNCTIVLYCTSQLQTQDVTDPIAN